MPLDPQVKELLQILQQMVGSPLSSLSPTEARKQAAQLRSKPLRPQAIERIENLTIPGPNGEIPIRIYTPEVSENLPILVFFHGGGWVLGDLEAADPACRVVAASAGCMIVSVDYRLAPEHKFPAPVEDAYAATCWVAKNAENIGGNPHKISVVGDSAGGNLAAAVSLMARDRGQPSLASQILIYPVTSYGFDTESYQLYKQGDCGLSYDDMAWFWNHYLNQKSDGQNPYASPLLAPDLTNLPPAFIITAECDVLRDEGEAYAAKLQSAGVPVKLQRYQGMIHGFVGMAPVLDGGKKALQDIVTYIRESCFQ